MNCTGEPTYYGEIDGVPMPKIIRIQRKQGTGIIKFHNGNILKVTLQEWLRDSILLHDFVQIEQSQVTGDYIVTNYWINLEIYGDDEE